MACNCEGKNYNISMGCCEPVLAPIENYYTKYQVDKLIESATTSGCCITPEEVDEKIASAKTEIENEIPSLSGYATEQWVLDKHYISGVDLSDYALKSEIPTVPTSNTAFTNDAGYLTEHQSLSGYATEGWVISQGYITYDEMPSSDGIASKQWVLNQNYASNSEMMQYITNLQQQIDSLKAQISGCCTETGETITRWITMTGASDYTCSGTTKMTKEKEQQSTDGGNTWTDTGNYRNGSTVLEPNCVECGYSSPLKYTATYANGNVATGTCAEWAGISHNQVDLENLVDVVVGECCTVINGGAFEHCESLSSVTVGSNVYRIALDSFNGCSGLTSCTILGNGLEEIQSGAFKGCVSLTSIDIPSSIKMINTSAFDKCTSLNSITVRATLPPKNVTKWTFYNTNNCPIYVPSGSVSSYKRAEGWSEYADRIRAIQ